MGKDTKDVSKWQSYIQQSPTKYITKLKSGDIFYIDTEDKNNQYNDHKFRPVVFIDGRDFEKHNLAPKTLEYHKKKYDGADPNMKCHRKVRHL